MPKLKIAPSFPAMRTKSRSRKKAADELFYPLRVRVLVPLDGFGRSYDDLHRWMDERAGRGLWGYNADCVPRCDLRDTTAFYMADPGLLVPFLEEFDLELAQGDPERPGESSYRLMGPKSGLNR
ncbi:hypothetical protein Q5Y75_06680 [Ruegeria sp. 2205SS24-7]|uniref:hypothetical protein n=1 Tax=Ruegeria discodermiae TaxID=3064389 RepID=UPI0027426E9D|nr:hypothetical protein [Ruegeria sp. 2205SS24-7]MDP5216897.1 hypothetical protein [Ruegeria sp. 2205SS24-7]